MVYEIFHHGQAQARTFTLGLGGEEHVKDAGEHLFVHAHAVIGHADQHILTRMAGALEQHVFHCQRDLAVRFGRITCVDAEVDQRIFKIQPVHADGPDAGGDMQLQACVLPHGLGQQGLQIVDQRTRIGGGQLH